MKRLSVLLILAMISMTGAQVQPAPPMGDGQVTIDVPDVQEKAEGGVRAIADFMSSLSPIVLILLGVFLLIAQGIVKWLAIISIGFGILKLVLEILATNPVPV